MALGYGVCTHFLISLGSGYSGNPFPALIFGNFYFFRYYRPTRNRTDCCVTAVDKFPNPDPKTNDSSTETVYRRFVAVKRHRTLRLRAVSDISSSETVKKWNSYFLFLTVETVKFALHEPHTNKLVQTYGIVFEDTLWITVGTTGICPESLIWISRFWL